MAAQVTNYKCPACTGPLHFSGESQRLECDYCGENYEIAAMDALYAGKEGASRAETAPPAGGHWSQEEAAHLRAYICPSCSAELVCDDTTAATSCPYCGNPTVLPGRFSGMLRPDFVIPFRLDKAAALAALKAHYKGKRFLPKAFLQENHLEEIKGIYVPFWLFDVDSQVEMQWLGKIRHSHSDGNEEVTTTEHYHIIRQGSIAFQMVPVDGASNMPDAHMDAIEPFDYGDLRDFSTSYLPGFLANKYDMDQRTCSQRAHQRIRASAEGAVTATVGGYSSLEIKHSRISLEEGPVKYALFPVWMLSTRWKEKSFLFAMNGQTGKLIGDLPVDKGRFWKWFVGISLPLMALLGGVLFLGGGIL